MSETAILQRIRLAASAIGARLLRNNIGVANYPNGQVVRFGVGGVGGADLVGWLPVTITPDMVGRRVAIFAAIEVKVPGKYATLEQRRFLSAVQAEGGIAGVARSEAEAVALLTPTPPPAPRAER